MEIPFYSSTTEAAAAIKKKMRESFLNCKRAVEVVMVSYQSYKFVLLLYL